MGATQGPLTSILPQESHKDCFAPQLPWAPQQRRMPRNRSVFGSDFLRCSMPVSCLVRLPCLDLSPCA